MRTLDDILDGKPCTVCGEPLLPTDWVKLVDGGIHLRCWTEPPPPVLPAGMIVYDVRTNTITVGGRR